MEEIVNCTKSELIRVFQKWNEKYQQNPEEFDEFGDPKQDAEDQAKYLIARLKEIQ